MPYIKKTLTSDESIIEFQRFHWIYFVSPIILLVLSSYLFVSSMLTEEMIEDMPFVPFIFAFVPIYFLCQLFSRLITYYTTEQVLTNKRVCLKTGFIRRDTDELLKEKIETVSIKQSILGRILRFGDIEFTGTGGIHITFTYITNPTKVKKKFDM